MIRLRANDRRIQIRYLAAADFSFSTRPRPALGPPNTASNGHEAFPRGLRDRGLKVITHLHPGLRLRMPGGITSLSQTSSGNGP